MSVNSLLYKNNLALNSGTINLSGTGSGNVYVTPIITPSTVLCPNLYVARAQIADSCSANLTLTNLNLAGWLNVDGNVSFQNSPPFAVNSSLMVANLYAQYSVQAVSTMKLLSAMGEIDVGSSPDPIAGQVLQATSNIAAVWTTLPSSGNITSNAFVITNNPVAGYVLTGIDSGNVSWQAAGGGGGNGIHSIWADYGNALPTLTSFVNVSNATAPTNGQVLTAANSTAAFWITPTVLPAALVAVEKKFNGSLYLTGVTTNANTNQTIFINEAIFDNTTESLSIAGSYVSTKTTNQLVLGTTNTTTINSTAPSASRVVTIPDAGADSSLVTDTGGALNITNTGTSAYVLTATGTNAANWAAPAATTSTAIESVSTLIYLTGVPANSTSDQAMKTQAIYINNNNLVFPAGQGFVGSGSSDFSLQRTTNQIKLGSLVGNYTILNSTAPSATRTVTLHDAGANSNFVLNTGGALTITDLPAGANEVLISSSTTGATWETALPSGLQPNLTGPITSVGVATAVGAQTGTGSTFVMQTSPTLTTPNIGVSTGTSLDVSGTVQGSQLISDVSTGTAPLAVTSTTLVNNLYVAKAALADTSTTIPNLTGVITSSGTTTSIGSQTGTGSVFVVQNTPTLTSPVIGAATGTSVDLSSFLKGSALTVFNTTNQIVMGVTNTATISATAPSASRTYTLNDPGANAYIPLSTNTGTSDYVLTSTGTNSCNWAIPTTIGGAGYTLGVVTRTLTATEIRGMYVTPIVLLTNATSAIGCVACYGYYVYATSAFTAGGDVRVYATGYPGSGFLNTTGNRIMTQARMQSSTAYTYCANGVSDAGIVGVGSISIDNATAAFTNGAATGTLKVTLVYCTFS